MPEEDVYGPLFERYRRELRDLYSSLLEERERVIADFCKNQGMSRQEAEEEVSKVHGPMVHDGRSVHLIRKYWLEIARLKKERFARDESFIEPLTFLVEDLVDEEEDDLVNFLTEISYWPVGLDENNEWS